MMPQFNVSGGGRCTVGVASPWWFEAHTVTLSMMMDTVLNNSAWDTWLGICGALILHARPILPQSLLRWCH